MADNRKHIDIHGRAIPVRIVRERRRTVRASLGKESVILRLPRGLTAGQEAEHWTRLGQWLRQQAQRTPAALDRYDRPVYHDGQELRVGERRYRLRLYQEDRKTAAAQLQEGGEIAIKLPPDLPTAQRAKAVRQLLSRVVAADFLPEITKRVHALNAAHFRRPIGEVRLKYNTSNWGSCSGKRNINLSTRLLFAPAAVVDYVIVHELAHLIEMNHSGRFWALVGKAMPDYPRHEAWLKEHGRMCDF